MNENFDCTQFVTFTYSESPTAQDIIASFEKQGFTLIEKNFIRKSKIIFFSDYIENKFYELKNDNFMGEFEDWVEKDNPPNTIIEFIQTLKEWMYKINVSHFKVFLTSYAELNGNTSCRAIKTPYDSLLNELFKMSNYYYGKHYDNMIIDILL